MKEPRSCAPFPTNKEEGIAYTKELAYGIELWAKIDVIVVLLAIFLWAVGAISAILLGLAVSFVVACPIILILLYSVGCLQYLEPRECYEILRAELTT